MSELTPGWSFVAITTEGQPVSIHGRNPWLHKWRSVSVSPITVSHPSYPAERHQMWVYDLETPQPVRFAAGEYSNGVWGFYVPVQSAA